MAGKGRTDQLSDSSRAANARRECLWTQHQGHGISIRIRGRGSQKASIKTQSANPSCCGERRFRIGYKAANEGHAALTLPERRRLLRSSDRKDQDDSFHQYDSVMTENHLTEAKISGDGWAAYTPPLQLLAGVHRCPTKVSIKASWKYCRNQVLGYRHGDL